MKILQMTIIFFVIYVTMGILDSTLNSDLSTTGGTPSILIGIMTQPGNWGTSTIDILGLAIPNFFLIFLGLTAAAVGTILVSTTLFSKSDIITLAPIAMAFMTMGAFVLVPFFNFMNRNVAMFACQVGTSSCMPSMIVASGTAGVLALAWLLSVQEWWMWRQTG